MPPHQESPRIRWSVMVATWTLCGLLILLHTVVVRAYVGMLDAQGLRGASEARTPLRQVIPARHADTQMWVRHVLEGQDAGAGRVRFTTVDNAPAGREVHWSSGLAWLLRGGAALQRSLAAPADGGTVAALEKCLLWFNAPLFLGTIILWSGWAAGRFGLWAGVLLAFAMVGHPRFREGFEPACVDHHGLITAAILGLMLGAAGMGFGWWRTGPAKEAALLPEGLGRARRAAFISALSGAIALWLSAASTLPLIVLVGLGGLMVAGWHGRVARAGGARFEPAIWQTWGRTGALASTAFYFLEYAPNHLGWRLEVNHPLYALAWWGGAELIALLAAAWTSEAVPQTMGPQINRPRDQGADAGRAQRVSELEKAGSLPSSRGRRPAPWRVLALLAAVVAPPIAIVFGGPATFLAGDPFVAALRHLVTESRSLPGMVREFGLDTVAYDLISALILVPAVLVLRRRRDDTRLVLGALTVITAAYLVAAFMVVRWWVVGSAVQIALLLWLVAAWGGNSRRRWAITLASACFLFLLPTGWVIARDYRANRTRTVAASDLLPPLYRDLAAALRTTQPEGPIILLASPNVSAGVGYFGQFQSLGTLFWENAPGLRAAAEIFCAEDDEEARRLLGARGVTHLVMISAAPFVGEYFSLLHPGRPPDEAKRTFGFRLMSGLTTGPRWLQPIPYRPPADLAGVGGVVSLFKVVPDQTEDQRLFHTALALAARGETAAAERAFVAALALVPAKAQASFCGFAGESAYEQGAPALAVGMLRRSLQLGYDAGVANLTAWVLATSTEPSVRDGVAALALVNPIAQNNPGDPMVASTLAAAYAELGRFDEAVRVAERALAMVRQGGGDPAAQALLAQRLETYRARRPWRQ